MNGLLLIDKPAGWTSFDVVVKVRNLLRTAQSEKPKAQSQSEGPLALDFKPSAPLPKVKVGHTGTLDPLATGLMLIVVGSYCKRAQEFSKLDKTYEIVMKLGQTSTTGDEEGEKTIISTQKPTEEEVRRIIEQFLGKTSQIPPAHSAIKVGGQRAYKLARAGKEVVLEPRQVEIYEITDMIYEYPEVKFKAKVSSGTYIRSLVADIGDKLTTGAYMTNLRRTTVGKWKLEDALEIDGLSAEKIKNSLVVVE